MGGVKERLISYLNFKELSKSEFGRRIGVSSAFVTSMRKSLQPDKLKAIQREFPDLNPTWLLTGEGAMLQEPESNAKMVSEAEEMTMVPLFSLESVAGFSDGADCQPQYIEAEMPWVGAHAGDFAVHVVGVSMEPKIPDGSILLVRPYGYADYTDLEFGRVHVVVTVDGRAMVKVIKHDPDHERHLLLVSYNPDFPPRTIAVSSVRRVFLAVAYQAPL